MTKVAPAVRARKKSRWKPKPEPSERRIQEPWPEQPERPEPEQETA
jgi:hypothetical protein